MPEPQRRPRKTPEQESLERLRRIETRITTLAIGLGVDMNTQKPVFDPGMQDDLTDAKRPASIELPSINSSMKEIMKVVPNGWTGPIRLVIGTDLIGQIELTDRS